MKKGYIVLENGKVFEGERFGAEKDVIGELVFTTGMEGYIETLTDPNFYGQIILHTFPLIGNYGWITPDEENNNITACAYVVREWCREPSNFRCEGTVDAELKRRGIPGICGVDTRELTRIIREAGVMNACITDDPESVDIEALKAYRVKDAVANTFRTVGDKKYSADGEERSRVTVIDYGNKHGIVSALTSRGCTVTVLPFSATAEEILATKPEGVVLSDGAGDPADNAQAIGEIKKLIGKVPMFGISLGHQLLALAMGARTEKLKYGHRGGNQPVRYIEGNYVYISAQNHGYVVDTVSAEAVGGKITFVNVNDNTCEGVSYPEKKAFSVQFDPAVCSGPDSCEEILFGGFIKMVGGEN